MTTLEESILAAFIVDVEAASYIPKLSLDDFIGPEKIVFEAIKDLYEKQQPIDIIMITEKIPDHSDYVYKIIGGVSSTINLQTWIKTLRIRRIAQKLDEAADEFKVEVKRDLTKAREVFMGKLLEDDMEINVISSEQATKEFIHEFEYRHDKQHTNIIQTHFEKLDRIVKIKPDKLILIAARPSVGKSAFALNVYDQMAQIGKKILIFSLEMNEQEIQERLISKRSRVDYHEVQDPAKMPTQHMPLIINALKEIRKLPIYYVKNLNVGLPEMILECKRQKSMGRVDVIFIDYLQLIKRTNKFGNTNDCIGEMTRELKLLACEIETPIILLSQLNREIEKRDKKTPRLSDLRDSGAIEQDADIVIFLSKKEEVGDVLLTIAKNRSGELGEIDYRFVGEYQLFKEI